MSVNPTKEPQMRMRYAPFALALVLFTASCTDERSVLAPSLGTTDLAAADLMALETNVARMLRHAADAPPLEKYQVTFWVSRSKGRTIEVDYRRPRRGRDGERFLKFEVPDQSVTYWPGMDPFNSRDSVKITLTLDPVLLSVKFEPSGLTFKQTRPAKLTFWYSNTDPDLNGDGAVNAVDWQLAEQIAIWLEGGEHLRVFEVNSENDWALQYVTGRIDHFSQYGVSW